MSKFVAALEAIIKKTGTVYQQRGGTLELGGERITPELLASPCGGLPAVLWLARIFYRDHEINDFLGLEQAVKADAAALLGYAIDPERLTPKEQNATQFLLLVSDFWRNECLPERVETCDFEAVFNHFRDWADQSVRHYSAMP